MGEVFGGIENLEIEWLNRINSSKIRLDVLTPSPNSFGVYKKNIIKYEESICCNHCDCSVYHVYICNKRKDLWQKLAL